jgi:ankyrin repeat protein
MATAASRLLLDYGADIESKNDSYRTPLSYAAQNGHKAVVRLLLEKGAAVDAKNFFGEAPVWLAAGWWA